MDPQESIAYHNKCLVCEGEKLTPLPAFSAHYLVRCDTCRFVFCHRIPTAKELDECYSNYGRNDYLSPITIKRYHELLDGFEKYRKTGRIIDVGCGIGYFLEVAKHRGWEVYGTEFTDEAVRICKDKGIEMQKGVLDASNYPSEHFDIITSFEVIEHINNPREEMAEFNKILRKGGLVYLTTPNFNALQRYLLKERYDIIVYPEHLSYYAGSTLTRLMKTSGFRKLETRTTGISITRMKTSLGKSNEAYISEQSSDEKLRVQLERNRLMGFIKRLVNWMLSLTGLGITLKGKFVK